MKIIRMPHNRFLPEYKTEGSSGMDLYAAIDKEITLKPLERVLVPTGIKIEIPIEYEAQIRARSGLSVKHGITLINAVGTVDADYRIKPDDRIAQMVIARVEKAQIEVTTELADSERGEGGFGSTGK